MVLIEAALAVLLAQEPTIFRATVPVVMVPVSVTDGKGKFIDGLEAGDFALFDDGSQRTFQLDTSDTVASALSVVIAVQANDTAPAALLKIRKIGGMVEPLITGQRGRAALLTFGSEVKLVQDFTNQAPDLAASFRAMKTQSGKQARMLDAAAEAVRMLAARPENERRVMIVVSESRDRGSETTLPEVIKAAQMAGVGIFTATFSAYTTPFTTKASELPASPGGWLGAIAELGRLRKTNTAQALAETSGGRKLSFTTLRGLESVVTNVGEELHSQYILTYASRSCTPGFHRIEVKIKARPDVTIRARYGYWTDASACSTPATQ